MNIQEPYFIKVKNEISLSVFFNLRSVSSELACIVYLTSIATFLSGFFYAKLFVPHGNITMQILSYGI